MLSQNVLYFNLSGLIMTFLDVLPANENDNDGIIDIMKNLQKYQAFAVWR